MRKQANPGVGTLNDAWSKWMHGALEHAGKQLQQAPTQMEFARNLGVGAGSGLATGMTVGAPLGALIGMGRGNTAEGLGRGMIRGGATGLGFGVGGEIGQELGAAIDPKYRGLGGLLGATAGAGLGYMGSGAVLGDPEAERRKKEQSAVLKTAEDTVQPYSSGDADWKWIDELEAQRAATLGEEGYRKWADELRRGVPVSEVPPASWLDRYIAEEKQRNNLLYMFKSVSRDGKVTEFNEEGKLKDLVDEIRQQRQADDSGTLKTIKTWRDMLLPAQRTHKPGAHVSPQPEAASPQPEAAPPQGVGVLARSAELARRAGLGLGAGALLGGATGAVLAGGRGAVRGSATGAGILGGGILGHAIGAGIAPQYGSLGSALGATAGGLLGYGGSRLLVSEPEAKPTKQKQTHGEM